MKSTPIDDPLKPFSAITRAWFTSAFDAPTSAQAEGWAAIARGEHTLVLAPTGSGKTLAAFLWALDRLHTYPRAPIPGEKPGVRVLYISPLKALIYDVERNLRSPLIGIAREATRRGEAVPDVRVGTRTGDTPSEDRRALVKKPPDILVTTPESLYLLLTSEARSILTSVELVIIDEIHAVAPTKRGAHLALSMERLERLIAKADNAAPQRIGLSATQRPLDEVARFLGGRSGGVARPVTIVDSGVRKTLELEIIVPVEDMSELGKPQLGPDCEPILLGAAAGEPEQRASIWPAIHPVLLDLIRQHRSTLIFVNSRRLAERLAAKLNELAGEELVRAHHGSIAREQRLEIEDALKAGKLPALVATSSLELGIDMGAIDLVIQVEAPSSVASGLQRIGRAGHQVGQPSRGKVFPKFRGDLLSAAVVAQRMLAGSIETTTVPRNPIDVLCQQIVALAASEPSGVSVEEVATMARGAYPFAELTDDLLDSVLDLLSGRYPSDEFADLRPRLNWDRLAGLLTARPGARMLAVTNAGTIPDRGLYSVVTPEGTKVGELDEEMVFESRVGETFLLGATTWRIEDITPDKVVVTPAPGVPGKMPFWHGDKLGRPYELGRAIGEFTRTALDLSDATLRDEYCLDPLAASNLRQYLHEESEATGGHLPTDRTIVVQRFRDELGDWQLCLLSPFGAQVHAPWAMAVEARVREKLGMEARAIWSDDGIMVRLPEADEAPPVDYVLIDPDELDELLVSEVGSSALFAARFRENAGRALLLPKRRPGTRTPLWRQRQRAANLLSVASRYGSFPIILETYRECLRDAFDVPALTTMLTQIRDRRIRIVSLDMIHPSPFASTLAFGYIGNFMYDGDAPLAERRAAALALDRDMLASLLGEGELRELIDPRAIMSVEAELQCLDPRRHARTTDAVHDLLRRVGDLAADEVDERCEPGVAESALEVLARERRAVLVRIAGIDRWIAAEDAGRYRDALGCVIPPGLPDAFLEVTAEPLDSLLVRYALTHVPFTTDDPALRLGVAPELVASVLRARVRAQRLLAGAFRPGGHADEWCDPEVLRILRQRSLALLRKEIEPTTTDALARFLPEWHGVGAKVNGSGTDRLYEVVEQLQGVAVPASVLERDVLPARFQRYSPRFLDELLAAGDIVWVGAGALGRDDGRVSLYLRDQAPLLLAALHDPPNGEEHDRLRMLLRERGACFFRELGAARDDLTLDALWDLVWAGEVTNDTYACVRALAPGRRGASAATKRAGRPRLGRLTTAGPPRAQGRWSLLARLGPPATAGAKTERLHALAVNLLERHGVLTREAVRGEGVPGGFAGMYPVLKALEEAGRVRRGYFVAGLGGAQFAVPGAVDRLREFRESPSAPVVTVLASTDPANAYGLALPWPVKGPQRVAGAYVVLVDGLPSLYLEKGGRSIVTLRPLEDGAAAGAGGSREWVGPAIGAVAEMVGADDSDERSHVRFRRLVLERVPDELVAHLKRVGFVPTPKGLAKYA